MIPQGQAVSRLSGYYRETAVLPPAGLGNMDVWEKYDLEEKSGILSLSNVRSLH